MVSPAVRQAIWFVAQAGKSVETPVIAAAAVVERCDRGGFREPITFQNRCTDRVLEIGEDLNGKRGTARGTDAQRFHRIGGYVPGHAE